MSTHRKGFNLNLISPILEVLWYIKMGRIVLEDKLAKRTLALKAKRTQEKTSRYVSRLEVCDRDKSAAGKLECSFHPACSGGRT